VFEGSSTAGGGLDFHRGDQLPFGDRSLEEFSRGQGAPSLEASFVEETEDFFPIEDDS
jgi:hypothetical protein